MASLRVFVSSTCYDLSSIRGQLRTFITEIGFEPIMSDYNDVLYDPRIHTHTSCIEEIKTCDIVILIVGSRFGGKAIPEAISKIDFDNIAEKSSSIEILKKKDNISVTQLEVLKALEYEMPIFTFIDNRLWHDHELYERNKSKAILKEIDFPSIDKKETTEFIFEFINFLRHRTKGNSINPFNKFEDIETALKKQWAGLFQRLLNESKNKELEFKRIDILSNQFEDLKTAILTSISGKGEREIARGVVRFRRLIDFMRNLQLIDYKSLLFENLNWTDFLKNIVQIKEIIDLEPFLSSHRYPQWKILLVKNDETFYQIRLGIDSLNDIELEYSAFIQMNSETRNIIFDALNERSNGMMIRYNKDNYSKYINQLQQERVTNSNNEDNSSKLW